MEGCNSDQIVEMMENILLLKKLRTQIESGKTHLPVPVEVITAEIENQRMQMENTLTECGSLGNLPEALAEIESSGDMVDMLPDIEEIPETNESQEVIDEYAT
ncbi:MAG: hypothetical protein PHC43_00130 [Candidatus Marinimicrobia bacterium]|nr:hypothetical protein [Candidatus Neomarinimicrobiota bacterium]